MLLNKFVLILLLSSCVLFKNKKENQSVSTYYSYLKENEIKKLLSAKFFESIISDYKINIDSVLMLSEQIKLNTNQIFKYKILSDVYGEIGDTLNWEKYTKKAVLLGYYPKYFSGYEKARSEYLNRIDTSTVRVLKYIDSIDQNARYNAPDKIRFVDSLTLYLMDSLIKTNNDEWLGLNKIGNNHFGITQNHFSHDIAIHHMEEEDNHRYFNLILKACKEGNEDWSCAEGIKWQQLRRFVGQPYTPYEYMKLRRLKIQNDLLDTEDDETLMTINEISKLIGEYSLYGKKAIIYPTVLIKDKDYLLLGKSLMYELSQFGIKEKATFDSSILMPMDSLEKIGNDYPFVVKIVEK